MLKNLGAIIGRDAGASRVALIDCRDPHAARERTIDDLDGEATGVAQGLLAAGLTPGAAIGILAENRSEYVTTLLGIWRAGMIAVPMSCRFTPAMIERELHDAAVALTFCDAAFRVKLPPAARVVEYERDFAAFLGSSRLPLPAASDDDLATVFFTSGSTGAPKPVPQTHRNHLWVIQTRLQHFAPKEPLRLVIAAPLFHTHAFNTSLFFLACGSTQILLPRFDRPAYLAACKRFDCDMLTGVPAMFAMLLRDPALAQIDRLHVRSIRMGGSPISERLWDDTTRTFPNATILNVYGATEAGPLIFGPDPGGRPIPPRACGWPVAGVEVRLVDEHGDDAVEGTLWIRAPSASERYRNAGGWFETSDRFRRDASGAYHFIGRTDDAFDCGGVIVYPQQVEALLERHPDIEEAVVVPVPDEIKTFIPVAFVVARPHAQLTEDDVKRFSLEHGPAYQHPRRVVFLDAFPLVGANKIDKLALRDRALGLAYTPAKQEGPP